MADVTATTGGGTGVLSYSGADKTTVTTFANRTALFLELFGGEVLNAFNQAQVTMGRHKVRTIPNGKSARFPATWKTSAYEHTPGNELVMQQVQHTEKVIAIDKLLVAPVFIDGLDEAMSHYPVRAEYSKQIGEILANTMDQNVLQNMTLAASAGANFGSAAVGHGGSQLGFSGAAQGSGNGVDAIATDGYDLLIDAIFAGHRLLDGKNVTGNRQVFMGPLAFWSLMRDTNSTDAGSLANKSPIANIMSRDLAGTGSLAAGFLPSIGGAELVKTNNLKQANITGGNYDVDQSKTIALMNTGDCVGTVKLLGLSMEQTYDLRRQGHILVGKYAVGHGILRPECAIEVNDAGTPLNLTSTLPVQNP